MTKRAKSTKVTPPAEVEYTPEMAALICDRVSDGESVIEIGRDPTMPAKRTIMYWLSRHPEFAALYAIAKDLCADAQVQEAKEILDDGSADYKLGGKDGLEVVVDHEHIRRSIARADHRIWHAGKLAPKKYGDKADLTVTLTDKRAVEMSEEELLAIASGSSVRALSPSSRTH